MEKEKSILDKLTIKPLNKQSASYFQDFEKEILSKTVDRNKRTKVIRLLAYALSSAAIFILVFLLYNPQQKINNISKKLEKQTIEKTIENVKPSNAKQNQILEKEEVQKPIIAKESLENKPKFNELLASLSLDELEELIEDENVEEEQIITELL